MFAMISRRRAKIGLIAALLVLAAPAAAFAAEDEHGLWKQIKDLYHKAKAAGDSVPADVADWVNQDIQKMNTWEYRVVTAAGDTPLEKTLNEFGADRWECFAVLKDRHSVTLAFKRPAKSYLKAIPLKDLFKLIRDDGRAE